MFALVFARGCAALVAVSLSQEGGEAALAADTLARRTVEVGAAGGIAATALSQDPVKRVAPHLPLPESTATATRGAFITPVAAAMVLAALLGVVATGLSISPVAEQYDDSVELRKFRRTYLIVWTVAIGTDWLQGPYVYALYQQFGFEHEQIAGIYLAGFLTASVMTLVMGPVTDRYGRRRFAMVYCFLTALQCVTKHFASYGMLMVGRLLGGMASCLLFTAFESWMVSETTRRGFSERALKYTFGCKELLSSAVAVAAGLVAQLAACGLSDKPLPLVAPFGEGSSFRLGGYCTSFDVVIFFCGVCALLTQFWWTENYGSSEGVWIGFGRAVAVLREPRVLLIGLVVALFESAMFLWVFIWTPSLSKAGVHDPPYALLFACFMAAKMAGSQVFTGLSAVFSTTSILLGAMILASSSHVAATVLIRMLALFDAGDARTSACLWAMLAAFILFEVAVGIYWPAAGVLKAQVVPESCRATLYSIFRLPLNAIVFLCLLFINRAEATLMATSVLLLAATMFAVGLTITLQAPSGLSKALLAKQDSRQYA